MKIATQGSPTQLSPLARELLRLMEQYGYMLTPTDGWRFIAPYRHLHDDSLDWRVDGGAAEELLARGLIAKVGVDMLEAYLRAGTSLETVLAASSFECPPSAHLPSVTRAALTRRAA